APQISDGARCDVPHGREGFSGRATARNRRRRRLRPCAALRAGSERVRRPAEGHHHGAGARRLRPAAADAGARGMTAAAAPIDARRLVGSHDILMMTLDTLRYDVAAAALAAGQTPNFGRLLPGGRWELRHSPASFTYAAHHAFFAGFLPTPAVPGQHPRLFAARFAGSATTTDATCVLEAADIVTGLAGRGYHTICIGGTGFFNKLTPLGSVLPGLFAESHWDETLGVASANSTERQVALAIERIAAQPQDRRLFLFVNIS